MKQNGHKRRTRKKYGKRNWNDKCYVSAGCGYKEFDFTSCPEVFVNILPDYKYKEDILSSEIFLRPK